MNKPLSDSRGVFATGFGRLTEEAVSALQLADYSAKQKDEWKKSRPGLTGLNEPEGRMKRWKVPS